MHDILELVFTSALSFIAARIDFEHIPGAWRVWQAQSKRQRAVFVFFDSACQPCIKAACELDNALIKPTVRLCQVASQFRSGRAVCGYTAIHSEFLAVDFTATVIKRPHATGLVDIAWA